MKNKFLIGLLSLVLSGQVMAQNTNKKTLVAYFSLSGNTKNVAEQIKDETGGDIYQIELVTPYPSEYRAQTDLAKKQLNEGTLPPIKKADIDFSQYDTIFVGTPVWWGHAATPVHTFMSENNFDNKKVVPFITHGGSGKASIVDDIKKLCPKCIVEENAYVVYGGSNTDDLSDWIKKINK